MEKGVMDNRYTYCERISKEDYKNLEKLQETLEMISNQHKIHLDAKAIVQIGKSLYDTFVKFHNPKVLQGFTAHSWDEAVKLSREDQIEDIRRVLHNALMHVVRSQAQSTIYVVGRSYGRIFNGYMKFDDDSMLTSWAIGKMAKGSYEEKSLGVTKLGFKIHIGDKIFLKFNGDNEDFIIYQKR